MTHDLRLGRWQDMLADVERVDCIITDPPYSERTHKGNNGGRRATREARREKWPNSSPIRQIEYSSLTTTDIAGIVASFAPRVRGWWAVMTDHTLAPTWSAELEAAGLYTFAPVPCVMPGMTCRLAGDGPSSWAVYLIVARPRTAPWNKWGTLPGAYVCSPDAGPTRGAEHIGGKPIALMSQIVRDYSRPGDIVCDPFAGHATTGVAALRLGRRFIGAECDTEAHARGLARLDATAAQPLLIRDTATQSSLL